MLSNIAYYIIYTSAILMYGIGMNRTLPLSNHPRRIISSFVKMLVTISVSAVLTYLVADNILVPVGLAELYPFAAVIIYSILSIFIESIIRVTTKKSTPEYAVSILAILLSVNESCSVFECFVISLLCGLSFFIFFFILYAVRRRISKKPMLVIISIAVILIILLAWNVSWLHRGGF